MIKHAKVTACDHSWRFWLLIHHSQAWWWTQLSTIDKSPNVYHITNTITTAHHKAFPLLMKCYEKSLWWRNPDSVHPLVIGGRFLWTATCNCSTRATHNSWRKIYVQHLSVWNAKINVNEVAYDMYQVCPRDFNDDSLIYSKQQKQDEATNRTSREDSCDKRTIDTGISA